MEIDVLSDAVAALTTAPALSVQIRARAPWGLRFGGRRGFGFHIVVHGECLLLRDDVRPVPLTAGDVVLVPGGEPHTLADSRDAMPVDLVVDRRVDRVTIGGDGIHTAPAEPWTTDRLAAEIGLARATFTRRFRSLVGESPLTYLTRWRMITAARLLRHDRATLASVARQVGYASEFAFAKAFKREYGLAPGAYRRLNSGRTGGSLDIRP